MLPDGGHNRNNPNRLQAAGGIVPIIKPTSWRAAMVPVMKKSGNVCICVDLNKLNEEVKRETFVLPTIHDITSKLRQYSHLSTPPVVSIKYHNTRTVKK